MSCFAASNIFLPLSLHAQPLLQNLFGGFKLPESAENEYLMKAVMRVIGWVDDRTGR